ncbi:hypothetical protein D1AOALGA4SA_3137 [Olavius algarvensis Delta 1 endosymbiont]|nr:hypothetical protein D1AOALGA4SA_3137 [Olavius algarvensis Delta 1 endosymbiont]
MQPSYATGVSDIIDPATSLSPVWRCPLKTGCLLLFCLMCLKIEN